jgi:hypothetical protein
MNAPPQQPNQSKWTPAIISSQGPFERRCGVAGARRRSGDEVHARLSGNSRLVHKKGTSTLKSMKWSYFIANLNVRTRTSPRSIHFLVGVPLVRCQMATGWSTINDSVEVSPKPSPPLHDTSPSIRVRRNKSSMSNRYPSTRIHQRRLCGKERGEKEVYLDVHFYISYHFISRSTLVIACNTQIIEDGKRTRCTIYLKKHTTIHTLMLV